MRWNDTAMRKMCHLLLFILSLGNIALLVGSAVAEERVRSARFAEAWALFEERKLERAIDIAHQAWTESREAFGPEDMRTFEAEELWLIIRIHERHAAGLPYDDLFPRLWAIEDKSIVRREIAYEMTWHYGEPGDQWPNAKHIILTYVSYPNYHEGIYSSELADHLETLGRDRICVVFSVTHDAIGEHKSHRIIEIGGITRWKSRFSYLNSVGAQGALPLPWEQVEQRDVRCLSDTP
ncbi:MAG: hypothetical protein O7I42_14205 [Alphaproteobacteria bacterium]|nr:hypothetical protein [Alphaproteobacteria bacterium]